MHSHAEELLILSNHERLVSVSIDAVTNKFSYLRLEKDQFEINKITYQYVPAKVMNDELIEVVIDYKIPIKEEQEKFGEIIKIAEIRRRFVIILGVKGDVKQVSEKTTKAYRAGNGD